MRYLQPRRITRKKRVEESKRTKRRKKVGLALDAAPCHLDKLVGDYIKKRTDREGRLVLEEIHGGLSVTQVCNLAVNREIKNLSKMKYLVCRREFI